MNLKNIFKKLVLVDFSLLVLIIVFSVFQSEAVLYFNQQIGQVSDMFVTLALITLVAYAISLYFLYKFKPIGKPFYFILFIIGIILNLISGSFAMDPFYHILDGLSWATSGAILVLLYFSPIKKEFDK